MDVKLFSVNIRISVPFCAMIAFLLCIDRSGLMAVSLAAAAVHETGHLYVMKKLRSSPREIICGCCGITVIGAPASSAREEVAVAVAGPAANVLTAVLFYVLHKLFNDQMLFNISLINAAVAALNLLPSKRLDGGTVFSALLTRLFGIERGMVFMSILSIIFAAAVAFFGAAAFFAGLKNPSLLMLGIYLVVTNIVKV